jgi:hypothetical protein
MKNRERENQKGEEKGEGEEIRGSAVEVLLLRPS